MDYVVRSSRRS